MKQNVYFHIITTDWHDSMVYPSSNPLYWNVNHVFPPVAWSIRYIYYVDNWAVLLVWNCNGNPLTYGTFSNSGKHTPRRTVDLQNVMNPHRRSRWIKKIVHIFFGLLHLHRKLNVWVHASFQFRFFFFSLQLLHMPSQHYSRQQSYRTSMHHNRPHETMNGEVRDEK